jgi:prepilin-type N-terminal cleavage/methylation domain-containing protein/prepilin-type processing-associated H-X9-DG protein
VVRHAFTETNPMRRAFTLIELLVVIAIIAILAAILFPVFAQAKAAAKATASLSNVKQSSLGVIMYAGDVDDNFVLVGYPDPTAPVGWDPNYIRSWGQSIMPYLKSGDILLDPQTAPGDYSWGTRDAIIGYDPQFGYDFQALAPVTGLGVSKPLSQTSLAKPAETVLLASKATVYKEYTPYWDATALDGSFTIGGPYCDASSGWTTGVNPQSWCNYVAPGGRNSWGKDSQPGLSFEAGGYTGLVSMRRGSRATVSFADGHAAAKTDTQLAAGTNYSHTLAAADLVINDKEKYLWDAD